MHLISDSQFRLKTVIGILLDMKKISIYILICFSISFITDSFTNAGTLVEVTLISAISIR